MGRAMLRQDECQETTQPVGEALAFAKLRELTRNGYVLESSAEDSSSDAGMGILLRHTSGPDLLLNPDGSIELPLGQTPKTEARHRQTHFAPAKMAKLRILMIVILAATFWFLSVAFTATILEGM